MPDHATPIQTRMSAAMKTHWKAFLIEGIVLVVLGLAAVALPPLASVTFTIMVGWLFLVSGLVGLYLTFSSRNIPGFWWSLLSAVLAIGAGAILLIKPLQGVLTLTLVLGAYFIAEGIASIMYAFEHRKELTNRWGWLVVAGVMDLIVAAFIIIGLPGSAAWALGLLIGINLVFGGVAMIAMALAARDG
jgi:uncharacterized membrane protein HdeD (DUF308 family)